MKQWKVKCFECEWVGDHEELIMEQTNESINFSECEQCPKCGSENLDDVKVEI